MKLELQSTTRIRGLAQAARRLRCSKAHLSMVLHGKREPSPGFARRMRRLGVRVADAEIPALRPVC